MAARKRAGNEDDSERQQKTSSEDSLRKSRQVHKVRVQAHQQKLDYVRWVLVVVALLLLAIGLYYYFTIYRTEERETVAGGRGKGGKGRERVGKGGKEREREREGGMKNRDTKEAGRKKKPTAKSKPVKSDEAKTGTKKKVKTEKKKSSTSSKGAKGKSSAKSKPRTKQDIPTISVSDMRLLRRPILPNDADRPYIIEILNGDNLLIEERYSEALEKFNEILKMFPQSPRGLFGKGETLTGLAEQKSSNKLRETAIEFYQDAANSFLAPKDLKVAALARLADLCQERGKHSAAIAALEKLYSLEGDDSVIANRLGTGYIKTGSTKKAEQHFRKVLNETPDNYYAKAHLGFLLFRDKLYEEALPMLMEGIRKDKSIRRNGRFYLYAGEALMRLNRSDEARVLYSEAVSHDLFPSLYQRSLFNEPDLRAQPWWTVQDTGYQSQLQPLLNAVENISSEVIPALLGGSHPPPRLFPIFTHGKKNAENCHKIPHTCTLLESVPEATTCKHGEVKFIVVPPGTHVPPHTAQTNTRLEVMVGLNLGDGELSVRLAEETRVLRDGGVLVYDDSFEQELWFKSLRPGLVLSIDVWHPDLSLETRRRLAPVQ